MFFMPVFKAKLEDGSQSRFVFLGYTADKSHIVAKEHAFIQTNSIEGPNCIFDALAVIPTNEAEFLLNAYYDRDSLNSGVRQELNNFITGIPAMFATGS